MRLGPLAWAGLGLAVGALVVAALPASVLFVDSVTDRGAGGSDAQYACPMFCVVMDEMPDDGRCPVCGMELSEVSDESKLTRAEQRMVGLGTHALRRAPLFATVRVVGEVEYDERRVSRVTTRVAGWLTDVAVDASWVEVEEGEPLVSIYSPELFAAQKEFLVARESGDAALLATARRRLSLLGIGEAEREAILESGEPREALILRAPRSGVVTERNALPGASVKKGETLVAVADLGNVWIQTEVYERDLPRVRVGQPVRLEVATRARPLTGRIAFVEPMIDRRTRTSRVRIEVANPKGPDGLRPLRIGQRVDAWIRARLDERGDVVPPGREPERDPLALPRSAVLMTGERAVAYVLFTEPVPGERDYDLDPDALPETVLYEMVPITVGPLAEGDFHPVLDPGAIPEGALVVTEGNLLLDSQAQLSGKPSLLFPHGSRGGGGGHAGH